MGGLGGQSPYFWKWELMKKILKIKRARERERERERERVRQNSKRKGRGLNVIKIFTL